MVFNEEDIKEVLMFFLEDTLKIIEESVDSEQPEKSAIICRRRLQLYISSKGEQYDYVRVLENNGYDHVFINEFKRKISLEEVYYNK